MSDTHSTRRSERRGQHPWGLRVIGIFLKDTSEEGVGITDEIILPSFD